ncbi:hypothetical protein CALCODRAFT_492976 [Calocera cornea HHB12733]|uniref:RTA1-domain-containing protein n=1 Tax=Calocera cornea HHB12733 TaxID=1353952 RepID=A0A165I0V3_9BASI|nr:hypothetical protein CALCODRAFT_492976 [Calocera cornea HHB12733]
MTYFPFDYAYLVGCWCAAVLWGAFTVLFGISMWLSRRKGGIRRVQVIAIIALYVLATASLCVEYAAVIRGFIYTSTPIDRIIFFSNVAQPLIVANDFIYIVMLVLSDLVLVWRCWVVWGKRWITIVLPIAMVVGEAVTGFAAIGQYLTPDPPDNYAAIQAWASALYALSLATNIMLSLLIAGRLWCIMRASSHLIVVGRHGTRDALRLVVESGLAITSAKIIEFVLFEIAFSKDNQNFAVYVLWEIMPQILGIIPTLILLSIQVGVIGPADAGTTEGSFAPSTSATKQNMVARPNMVYGRNTSDMPVVSVETAIYKDPDDNGLRSAGRRGTGSSSV